jgi:hypothetical protein
MLQLRNCILNLKGARPSTNHTVSAHIFLPLKLHSGGDDLAAFISNAQGARGFSIWQRYTR